MQFYFKKRTELRRVKFAFLTIPVGATATALYASIGMSLNGALYVAAAVGSWLLYLLVFSLILYPANSILIRTVGRKQLLAEQRNIARVIINDFFDGKSEIALPEADDNLVMAEAIGTFDEYFEEQQDLYG